MTGGGHGKGGQGHGTDDRGHGNVGEAETETGGTVRRDKGNFSLIEFCRIKKLY